jgi:Na+-translocating ferredoxin:NAD+ oxidoreductase RnfC subunit
VTKGTSGITVLTRDEVKKPQETNCLRCGRCVDVCPVGLVPTKIALAARHRNWGQAKRYWIGACIECGSCAYECPASIPLVQLIAWASGCSPKNEPSRNHRRVSKGMSDVSANPEAAVEENAPRLQVAAGPHLSRAGLSTQRMMADVLIGLAPVVGMAIWVFREYAILQIGICVLSCVSSRSGSSKAACGASSGRCPICQPP